MDKNICFPWMIEIDGCGRTFKKCILRIENLKIHTYKCKYIDEEYVKYKIDKLYNYCTNEKRLNREEFNSYVFTSLGGMYAGQHNINKYDIFMYCDTLICVNNCYLYYINKSCSNKYIFSKKHIIRKNNINFIKLISEKSLIIQHNDSSINYNFLNKFDMLYTIRFLHEAKYTKNINLYCIGAGHKYLKISPLYSFNFENLHKYKKFNDVVVFF